MTDQRVSSGAGGGQPGRARGRRNGVGAPLPNPAAKRSRCSRGATSPRSGNGTRSIETVLRHRGAAPTELLRSLRGLKALEAEQEAMSSVAATAAPAPRSSPRPGKGALARPARPRTMGRWAGPSHAGSDRTRDPRGPWRIRPGRTPGARTSAATVSAGPGPRPGFCGAGARTTRRTRKPRDASHSSACLRSLEPDRHAIRQRFRPARVPPRPTRTTPPFAPHSSPTARRLRDTQGRMDLRYQPLTAVSQRSVDVWSRTIAGRGARRPFRARGILRARARPVRRVGMRTPIEPRPAMAVAALPGTGELAAACGKPVPGLAGSVHPASTFADRRPAGRPP
jgi:hypothetical protein